MKTYFFLLVTVIINVSLCLGQTDSVPVEKPSRWNLSIVAGGGLPIGDFAKFEPMANANNYTSYNLAGEAELGYDTKVMVNYMFNKHIGILGSLYYASFEAVKKTSSEIFVGGSPFSNGSGTVEEIGKWNVAGVMIGGVYEISCGRINIGFILKCKVGFFLLFLFLRLNK